MLNDVEEDGGKDDGTAVVTVADDCGCWCWPVLFPTDVCSIPRLLLEFTNGCADVVGVVSVAGCSMPAARLLEDVGGPGKGVCPPTPPTPPPAPPTPPPPPVPHVDDGDGYEDVAVDVVGTLGNGRRERGPMQQQSAMLEVSSSAGFSGDFSVSRSLESFSLEFLFRRLSWDSSRGFDGGRLSCNETIVCVFPSKKLASPCFSCLEASFFYRVAEQL